MYKQITKGLSKSSPHSHASTISKRLHTHTLVLSSQGHLQYRLHRECPLNVCKNRYGRPQGYTCMGSTQRNNKRLQDSQGQTLSALTVAGTGFLRLCSCLCPDDNSLFITIIHFMPSYIPLLESTDINTSLYVLSSLCLLNAITSCILNSIAHPRA